jgi:hypothetical protein
MIQFRKLAFLLIAPLMLFGCVLTPGKFVSTLKIDKDRSFTFTYKGEVVAVDFSEGLGDAFKTKPDADEKGKSEAGKADAEKTPDEGTEAQRKAIGEALTKEEGYKSVVYLGKGKFLIDYEVSGKLTHHFLFPFNSDAEAIIPFMMVEVRGNGTVRMRAPGFANDKDTSGAAGMAGTGSNKADLAKMLDGVFTLDTDAEIVSQNQEDGASKLGGRSQVVWKVNTLTKDAPTAVIRFAK